MRLASLVVASVTFSLQPGCVDGDEHEEDGPLFEAAYEEGLEPGKEDGTDCSGVRVPDRSGFAKRVALTFDDGPNPETTPKVIEVLKRHGAPATFFTNGSRYGSQAAKDIAARIAADPDFILANHSHNHKNLAQQSAATVGSEIDRTNALISAAGGTPRYFRFPFGSSTCSTMNQVRSRNMISAGWHVDSADWCYAAGGGYCKASTFRYVPDDMRGDMKAYVMSQVASTGGGIILFHDIHPSTANSLDGILTALTAAGYTFVRLDDTAVFPKLHGTAPQPSRFVGDTCTTDAQCAFTAGGQPGRCHPAGFCTISCAGSCPDLAGKAPTFCIADSSVADAGLCVSKPSPFNQSCAALPRTQNRIEARFVGGSGSSPATANVCAPL